MMADLRFIARDLRRLDEVSAEIVACGVYRDERPLSGLAGLLDWRLSGRISRLAKQEFLLGELGEVLAVPVRPRLKFDKVLVMGLGPRSAFGDVAFRQVLERTMTALSGLLVKKAVVELPGRGDGAIEPEQAVEIMFDLLDNEERDAVLCVEDGDAQKRFEKHAQERRRILLRAQMAGSKPPPPSGKQR
jgi:cytosol aminopeptidase family protein